MADVNDWHDLPEGATGQQIRSRHVLKSVVLPGTRYRLGGEEPKAIVVETRDLVIYRIWSADGRDLGERSRTRDEFEAEFERRPSDG